MQSPSPSDRPSSISPADPGARAVAAPTRIVQVGGLAALSVAVTAIAFALADAAFSDSVAILVAGVAAVALVGALAAHAVQRDARRLQTSEEWQRRLRGELMSQAAFLDEVVGSLAAMTSTRDAEAVLAATAEQAHRLLRPDATVVLVPSADGRDLRPAVARGIALGPIAGLGVDPASPDSLLAEAAASRTPAAGPVKPGGDALTKHLRPVAALAVPLVVLDELHALLVLFRLQGEGTFGICSFWFIECLAKSGDVKKARFLFEKMLGYANHLGLYAEELGPSGEHLGNFPQAFTHLALISAAYALDRKLEG